MEKKKKVKVTTVGSISGTFIFYSVRLYFLKICFYTRQGLLLLQQLTKSNAAIQKIVAFESAFERLLDIITEEGSSDGGKKKKKEVGVSLSPITLLVFGCRWLALSVQVLWWRIVCCCCSTY